ncbi:type II toxin-antitoxin system RelE/ParE family toxin [Altererythrobacter xixiisoli]|uniref:Type II toxin-antitoxin system RelE/ParE family toxin n=1 Tax=Croceibacterium xixiisoli TaxID=1476466 RepID=A0A6I4TYK7_9SPHN|nr:type II toxin-antitoxin system RelE/ParE family toxin [Croceibacterium xixiisoli]MXP00371.1 type II toxin-antitoxin system RelE/ParE family toxin [Croceibacterium xixiisoli]
MTAPYVLGSAAESDLRDILRYTRDKWGVEKARHYASRIKAGIENAASGDGMIKDMSEFYPGLRMLRCQHHWIFCLPRQQAPALIVAILHERMDLMVQLVARMEK